MKTNAPGGTLTTHNPQVPNKQIQLQLPDTVEEIQEICFNTVHCEVKYFRIKIYKKCINTNN